LEKLEPQRQGAASFENAAAGNKNIEEISSVQFQVWQSQVIMCLLQFITKYTDCASEQDMVA